MSELLLAVVAKGAYFAAGTPRTGEAAKLVPDGPWWSESGDAQSPEPPRSGKGSGVEAWREYATSLGVEVADDATRDDIIAVVDGR